MIRLAALKKSGDEEWKKKVSRSDPVIDILDSNQNKIGFENEKSDSESHHGFGRKEKNCDQLEEIPNMRRNRGVLR